MLSERSTIWATSPYSSKFELASEHNSWKTGFRFVTSCQFLPIISKYKPELSNPQKRFGDAEDRSPYLSHAKQALYLLSYIPVLFKLPASFEQNSWNISFPFVTSCQFIPIISKYKPELSNPQKRFGDAGHRSPYFSHAKRALYHLSYIPVEILLRASFWTQFMKNWLSICNELSIFSHYKEIQTRIIESSKLFWRCGASIPVLFKLRASFWTQFLKNRFSICNELSIPSHYQQIQMRVIESSKMFWRCWSSIPVPLARKASALPFDLHPRNDFASR